ncbi:uncharacterized protein QC763_208060 [Podospora pseudopauciseta]|uniref:Heterokaryon incompatibility domain-containing protein n=1 Tax=Podospora pseudopauciseta TaxID=2093780 RepID=A0ABR0HQ75_9PEZI|nr:hypothetical protein QC763_208060 [Podospora pseudopauciseta]
MASTTTSAALDVIRGAMLDAVKATDFTPEDLQRIFKELGASHEKLRAIMNVWFGPNGGFRPTFVEEKGHPFSGLQDVEILTTSDPPSVQTPGRMFDLETGNLFHRPAIGERGQYCMLSHRWKGAEVSLGDITRARGKYLERAKAGLQAMGTASQKSDVQMLLEQCHLDISAQEATVKELYLATQSSGTLETFSLANLLDRRLKDKSAEDYLNWAKVEEQKKRAELRFAEMESKIFSNLISSTRRAIDDAGGERLQMPPVVQEKKEALDKAKKQVEIAEKHYAAAVGEIDYFKNHSMLRDAIDGIVPLLEKWKSAIKIDRSVKKAGEIFKTKLFRQREKCYLWNDTCCINKMDFGELSQSLSLMGDWYADAEFTLVQLDNKVLEDDEWDASGTDAAQDWREFQKEHGEQPEPYLKDLPLRERSTVQGFEHIVDWKPEWSTRAWTLQELIMSKTTFYVNADWATISRPVESLGYLYHLVPFIALYTQRDKQNFFAFGDGTLTAEVLRDLLAGYVPDEMKYIHEWTEKEHTSPPNRETGGAGDVMSKAKIETAQIERAHLLIMLLHNLGVQFPEDLAMETVTSQLAHVVYNAAVDLVEGSENDPKTILLARLTHHVLKKEVEIGEEDALNAINFVLRCLVDETLQLVLDDRKYVAKFSKVEKLGDWQDGKKRCGFSAENVLEASGCRRATVAIDRAYALMGVLGVRFPTFPAEGYATALARLLDQVIITHNDVSVFNWTGMAAGSPVRGRSLYPSSQQAYGNQKDHGKHYNLQLSQVTQGKMDEIMKTYGETISVLRRAIDAVKDKDQKDIPFDWIVGVIGVVRGSDFHQLKERFISVGKVVAYILKHCVKKVAEKRAVPGEAPASGGDGTVLERRGTGLTGGLTKGFSFSSLPSPTMSLPSPSLSLPSPSLSMSGFKIGIGGSKKEEPVVESPKKASRLSSFTKKSSSFGIGRATPDPVAESAPSPIVEAPPPVPPTPQALTNENVLSDGPSRPGWVPYDSEVKGHLEYLSASVEDIKERNLQPKELPKTILDVDHKSVLDELDQHSKKADVKTRLGYGFDFDESSTICPNPIIVNNSGIESLFDIQRVIVTFLDCDRLRARIAKAVTPKDRISGWCSISTGFARVISGFSCEKRLLEQELNAVEGIESRVLKEQHKGKAEKRSAQIGAEVVASSISPANGGETLERGQEKKKGDSFVDIDKETEEERLVSRMIEFIQEPQLELVAGEWVLARFSGVPGAKWFLCHLELGSARGKFYGHRIPTGEIDFTNSTPEPGLVKAWQVYMERKKSKMCHLLERYLKSRENAKHGEAKLKQAKKTLADVAAGVMPEGHSMDDDDEEGTVVDKDSESEDEESTLFDADEKDEEGGSSWRKFKEQSKEAARELGEFTVFLAQEKFWLWRAERLERKLSTAVLKRTPAILRTAVENVSDNKGLLPGMYHSAVGVHMF